jgi:RHS repeat-associated protein
MKETDKYLTILFLMISSLGFSIVFTTTQAGGNSSKDLIVQAGKQYQLKFDLQHQTTSAVRIQIVEGSTIVIDETNLIDGTHVFSFTPTTNTVSLKFIREDADNVSRDFEVDNLVYEEISQVVQVESNHEIGRKEYELIDHLGNVRAVVSDKKVNGNTDAITATDYLPFGMSARSYSNGAEVRYSFNGMEKNEEWNEGSYDFGARIYDSRLARFLSIDPKEKEFPSWSPYVFAIDNPIKFIDDNGEGPNDGIVWTYVTKVSVQTARGIETVYLAKRYYQNITPQQAQAYQRHAQTPNGWFIVGEDVYNGFQNNSTQNHGCHSVYGANTPDNKAGGLVKVENSGFVPVRGFDIAQQSVRAKDELTKKIEEAGTLKMTNTTGADVLYELYTLNDETNERTKIFSQVIKEGESALIDYSFDAEKETLQSNFEGVGGGYVLSFVDKAVTGNPTAPDTLNQYATEQPTQADLDAAGAKIDSDRKK